MPEKILSGEKLSAGGGVLFGTTIFLSAFLLFQVQPMIAKMILPWFGGSSAVWTTCLLFFQVVLLLGYLYAFWLMDRFTPWTGSRIHLVLLALCILALPIIPNPVWMPAGTENPSLRILWVLGVTVGLPYFLLATSSPLLQAWYARSEIHAKPYRLFALSNAGSLLGLLTYPVLVEPNFSTRHQALGWSLTFAGYCLLCGALALRSKSSGRARAASEPGLPPPPKWSLKALWVALTACASILLLAITNYLSQNVAAIPFLWILPLSLYLLSFVLCFEGRGWYRRGIFLRFFAVAVGAMAYALSGQYLNASLVLLIPLFCTGLFLCCMVCHGELARLKPHPRHLTSFYLMSSLGGAVGGVFVGLIAPYLFSTFYELPIGLASCDILALVVLHRDPSSIFFRAQWKPSWVALVSLTLILTVDLAYTARQNIADSRVVVRNFYGRLKVMDYGDEESEDGTRQLVNGTIVHGEEYLAPDRRLRPTTYFSPASGIGLALRVMGREGKLNVGVIGLGAGTIAAYGRPGDRYTFYDINPLVIQLAKTEFYFLKDSPARNDIVLGDARLSLERQPGQDFDVLAVDAFTGDAIPVHLLTREAFVLYFHQLKPNGVLAVHVSNRFLDLPPVVKRLADSLGKKAVAITNAADEENVISRATWVLVSARDDFFAQPEIQKASTPIQLKSGARLWTDDYSSLFEALK